MSDPNRPVVRCPHCKLRQYETVSGNCRRCKLRLREPEPPVVEVAPPEPEKILKGYGRHPKTPNMAEAIKSIRMNMGLSQRDLAIKMKVPRTYVSKIENAKAEPTLTSLYKFAAGFGLKPQVFIMAAQKIAEEK